jgi:hypothetical protein
MGDAGLGHNLPVRQANRYRTRPAPKQGARAR